MRIIVAVNAFLKNNWVSILSILIGVSMTIYSVLESKKEREPAYFVTKNVGIFSSPQGLSSEYFSFIKKSDGREVSNNVYLLEASFWNKGREPIRAEDVLDQISITYNEGVEIIDAFIAKAARKKITKPELKFNKAERRLHLNFRVLEEQDVIVIQVLYSAKEPSEFNIEGAILGVKSILKKDDLADEYLVDGWIKTMKDGGLLFFGYAALIFLIAGCGFLINKINQKNEKIGIWIMRIIYYSFSSAIILLIIMAFVGGALNNAKKSVIENIPTSEQMDR